MNKQKAAPGEDDLIIALFTAHGPTGNYTNSLMSCWQI